jgi:hypothetical protein
VGIHINNMKTIHYITSILIAAASPGMAFLALTNLIPASVAFGSIVLLGFAGLVIFDYARPVRSLRPLAPVLRPVLPSESASPVVCCARRAA